MCEVQAKRARARAIGASRIAEQSSPQVFSVFELVFIDKQGNRTLPWASFRDPELNILIDIERRIVPLSKLSLRNSQAGLCPNAVRTGGGIKKKSEAKGPLVCLLSPHSTEPLARTGGKKKKSPQKNGSCVPPPLAPVPHGRRGSELQ
jgi:hypothetical protein